jgi:hypothetical protein
MLLEIALPRRLIIPNVVRLRYVSDLLGCLKPRRAELKLANATLLLSDWPISIQLLNRKIA